MQLQRLMEQRGLSERESQLMIAAQMPLEEKARRAQFVVENSGSLRDTEEAVRAVHAALAASRFHWRVRAAVAAALGGIVALVCIAVRGAAAATTGKKGGAREL